MSLAFPRTDAVLRAAAGEAFTGAVARIEVGGSLCFERAYGVTRSDRPKPVYVDTRFDLASITKLFVSTAALALVDRGVMSLDRPLADLIPEWRERPQRAITLRMLMAHTSGMFSGADYRTLFGERLERYVLARELAAAPAERVLYSDLGMIALGVVLERACAGSLPSIVAEIFPQYTIGFVPVERERPSIPATEEDSWRGRVQGSVHDEKAHLMNGVAGHAGLFGTAADVARLAELFLSAASGRAGALISAELARDAIREHAYDPVLRRGLGWALKTSDENSCGRWFSKASFGHTGFVGTCVWADPDRDIQGVLLTNTVYFGRNDSRLLRAAFYEALVEDIGR